MVEVQSAGLVRLCFVLLLCLHGCVGKHHHYSDDGRSAGEDAFHGCFHTAENPDECAFHKDELTGSHCVWANLKRSIVEAALPGVELEGVCTPDLYKTPYDSEGLVCGKGKNEGYPYLYFLDPHNYAGPRECVKECWSAQLLKYGVEKEDGTSLGLSYTRPCQLRRSFAESNEAYEEHWGTFQPWSLCSYQDGDETVRHAMTEDSKYYLPYPSHPKEVGLLAGIVGDEKLCFPDSDDFIVAEYLAGLEEKHSLANAIPRETIMLVAMCGFFVASIVYCIYKYIRGKSKPSMADKLKWENRTQTKGGRANRR